MARLPSPPFVYPILDLAFLAGRSVEELVAALGAGGARLVQVRGKETSDHDLLAAVRRALAAARAVQVAVIVNDRPDVALLAGADGVHVGQDDLPPSACRQLLGAAAIVGCSTHGLEQVDAMAREPVDYLAIGPVFATTTKVDTEPLVGPELLRVARTRTPLPLVAIGGLNVSNAAAAVAAGADGVASISAVFGGGDVAERVRALREALERAS